MDISEVRFLVVEDQGFQRWAMGAMLQQLGALRVHSASDGKAALTLVREQDEPFDIVVSDLDMPEMDGMEFIRHLTRECKGASLIIVSGLEGPLVTTVATMAAAYGANVLGCITKPATAGKLAPLLELHPERLPAPRREQPVNLTHQIKAGLAAMEFLPHFQPKVEVETRRLRGAEALARWHHPEHGLLLPGVFMPPLEAGGFIDDLTVAMVRSAAQNCRGWIEADLDLSVAVNLSLASLSDITLADRMTALVEEEGLEPRCLTFEITESAAASHVGRALENVSRLRMKGFGLSIDDFGTGYSSMERLARVPFTELKVDRSFLKNAATQPASRAVLESCLEMARKLSIPAVAEGVETEHEWNLLRELGCPLAQGYFISRPMPATDFLAWARP